MSPPHRATPLAIQPGFTYNPQIPPLGPRFSPTTFIHRDDASPHFSSFRRAADKRYSLADLERQADSELFERQPTASRSHLSENETPARVTVHSILVDDPNHQLDITRIMRVLIEGIWSRNAEAIEAELCLAIQSKDLRSFLSKGNGFFESHIQQYSKSGRKAPIYWPLSTPSMSYTLWIYSPRLTSQTLYTATNNFVEPKLKQVQADVTLLRSKGAARSRDDEKQFEALQAFEFELIELRDTLLKLAPKYVPNHDDGVQICAAPLWSLFRHKPWQNVLKDTWTKLEMGDYDWAHLAMNYWPERVREKCKTDKSLAIAHGLEDLYLEPEAQPKKSHGKKKGWASQ